MGLAQKRVLVMLSEKDYSVKEIAEVTGYSTSGIRGRISELRNSGYTIGTSNTIPKKYRVVFQKNMLADKILDFAEKSNMYGTRIEYSTIAKILHISYYDVRKGMYELYRRKRLIQLSNNTVMITRKI